MDTDQLPSAIPHHAHDPEGGTDALRDPALYLNRELSQLDFNFRVLAQAQEPAALQSLDAIRSTAEHALRRQIDAQLGGVTLNAAALDARLRLPACASPLEAFAQPPRGNQARALVRVSCSGGTPWSLNVPVEIRREIDVLVLRRPVARGEILGSADVVAQKRAALAGPGEVLLLTVGRLHPEKGYDQLFPALQRALPRATARPRLLVAGTGPHLVIGLAEHPLLNDPAVPASEEDRRIPGRR